MIPDPLHPAVVHFPMALAGLLPLVALVSLLLIHRGTDPFRSWLPVLAVAVVLAGSAWGAVETGEREEEVVEEVVSEDAIHEHEEAAEVFLWTSVGLTLLLASGLLAGRVGQTLRWTGLVGTLLLLAAGARVGHFGGELVYTHGAASAYIEPDPGPDASPEDAEEPEEPEEPSS